MRCPNCGTLDGRVIDSRDLDDSTTVRRRRECNSCRSRYTTYERVESARLIVLKSNGTREEFDRDKLAAGLTQALTRRPVAADAASEAADAIESALRARGLNEVPSTMIGEMAMDGLRGLAHARGPGSADRGPVGVLGARRHEHALVDRSGSRVAAGEARREPRGSLHEGTSLGGHRV